MSRPGQISNRRGRLSKLLLRGIDREFRTPSEIRKANLCGADLRGAKFDRVDFYLVDLRGARFDAAQGHWFRKCGAILTT